MPPAALLLVLGAAVCHSLWNLLLKSEPRRLEVQSGALVVAVLLASPVLLLYPLGAISPYAWLLIVVSALFETAYVFCLTGAYAAGDLSLVYPVARGTAPLVVAPLAVAIFGERLSLIGGLGIALVVGGIYGSHVGTAGHWSAAGSRRALGLAVLTGTMTAGYSLVNRMGVRAMPVPLYGVLVIGINAVLVLLARQLLGGELALSIRRDAPWGRILVVAVLMMGAYLAVLMAMTLAPVSYVVAARETSIVVTVILSALVLREPPSLPRL